MNVLLAQALSTQGINAKPEVIRSRNKRIDIEIKMDNSVIAIEAEHGQSNAKRNSAVKDAISRLTQGLVDCAIALCYPDNTTASTFTTSIFEWAVLNNRDTTRNWTSGGIEELISVIVVIYKQVGNPDRIAKLLSNALDESLHRLNNEQKRLIAKTLDLPKGQSTVSPWQEASKRGLLVVATAVMFHTRLDSHLSNISNIPDFSNIPAGILESWPPRSASDCANHNSPTRAFAEAWSLILVIDYKPIFETARAVLNSLNPDPSVTAAINATANAALDVVSNIAGLRHDLLGRIFHTVLNTARYDGSFYTTTSAATLLAALALDNKTCNWNDAKAISKLRITDPACGTGTLLMAAAERIRNLAPQFRDNQVVSRALIEEVLTGYDVNLTATHMAATTLGLLSPTTHFRNLKIGRTLLGVDKEGNAYLGSLEFLDKQPKLMTWSGEKHKVVQVDTGEKMEEAEQADLVIMNPPFTRNSLRHDQFERAEELAIKKREQQIFSKTPVHLSGNAGTFIVLADHINKPDTGVFASVLPLVMSTNASGRRIRKFLAERYHVETIVTSHDPERIYFSENTNIGEMLLVCRRWNSVAPKPPTYIVNLATNPSTPAEAISVAGYIKEHNDTLEHLKYGTVQEWSADKIVAGDWGGVQFLSPYLCKKFNELKEGKLFDVLPLSTIADIGPGGPTIRVNFTRYDMPLLEGYTALWYHKTDVTQSMLAHVDSHIKPKKPKRYLAERYWNQRGKLMLPERIFLPTVRVMSIMLELPAVGSAWMLCKPSVDGTDTTKLEKAICVYLNSTVGILAMLGNRSNKKPTYPQFSIDNLRNLSVPDFTTLSTDTITHLATAYDKYANHIMQPLPQMDSCPVRKALDTLVKDALQLDAEEVTSIRRNLSSEPSVTGKRFGT